jgi:hypothetical protein
MRSTKLAVALVLVSLALPLHAADCPAGSDPTTITLDASAADPSPTFVLNNPAKDKTDATACLLTEADLKAGLTCTSTDRETFNTPPTLTLGVCTAGVNNFSSLGGDAVKNANTILLSFTPRESGRVHQYLRVEADSFTRTYEVTATAGVPNLALDSRYKVWLYTGYTYLRSKGDFQDGFPELLARFETRLYDEGVAMRQLHHDIYTKMINHECDDAKVTTCPCGTGKCGGIPKFGVIRLYGETGLTGTAVVAGDDNNTSASSTKQSLEGSFGVGFGVTLPVTVDQAGDTHAFTILSVSRLGVNTIPGVDADPNATPPVTAVDGKTAFNWFTGVRIENENGGNFEGTYFELGAGESEQFSRKKVARLRADGLIPLSSASNALFRFALRLQLDTARPFHPKQNDAPAGEIRVSILFNMDLHELSKRLGGK